MQLQLLNVEAISTGGDCIEDILISICAFYNRRYEMMYMDSLYFAYSTDDQALTIGERIQTNLSDGYHVHLEQYHGLSFQFQMDHTIEQDLDLLEKQLQGGNPVIVTMDSFYIPWDAKYHNTHYMGHVFLAVGIDRDLRAIYGTDPFFQKITQKISYKDLLPGYQGCITLKPVGEEIFDFPSAAADMRNRILFNLQSDHIYNAMENLANDLANMDYEIEMAGVTDLGSNTLFLNLGKIGRWRLNYAKMLQFLETHYSADHFKAVIDQLKMSSFLWASVKGLVAKGHFLKEQQMRETMLQNAVIKLKEIVVLEKKLALQLVDLLDQAEKGEVNEVVEPVSPRMPLLMENSEIVFLQLQSFFNCRGFENELNTADLDTQGYYFTSESKPKLNPLEIDHMFFSLAEAEGSSYDNIACYGQTIELEAAHYHSLMFLGCSEMGTFLEKITIEYEDQELELFDFGFSDWWNQNAMEDETIAWRGQIAQQNQGYLNQQINMYARRLELNSHKRAVKLILPLVPNIHLFAASLSKARSPVYEN